MSKNHRSRALKRVLLVHKHSTYQQEAIIRQDPAFLRLVAEGSKAVCNMQETHAQHYRTVEFVRDTLQARGAEVRVLTRDDKLELAPDCDLVVTVGGDGTFLHCARDAAGVPMLGVNSAKPSSLGHYCLADIDTFAGHLDEIASGARRYYKVARLQLVLNGTPLPVPVLNEVLIHDANAAGTTRYVLSARGREEVQRSSGIYIGTAAGSTAVMRSAGGKIIPVTQRKFQYIVREPGMRPSENWTLLRGILNGTEELRVLSQTPDGMLFIDGKFGSTFAFRRGDELVARLHPVPVLAYIDPNVNKRYRVIR